VYHRDVGGVRRWRNPAGKNFKGVGLERKKNNAKRDGRHKFGFRWKGVGGEAVNTAVTECTYVTRAEK